MPLFDWEAKPGEPVMTSRFWIYWVVTVPLTLVVVTTWLVWLKRKALLRRRQDKEARASWGIEKVTEAHGNGNALDDDDDTAGKEKKDDKLNSQPLKRLDEADHNGLEFPWAKGSILPQWMRKRRAKKNDKVSEDSKA